ncbi:MAG: copper homeostasis protein CutC [Roseivirga sp.]|nr:copper homeostasis protein CutC [Roseivirga sp.]
MLLEICANSVQSAINAQTGGADRIELCYDLTVGGVTPTEAVLKEVREKVSIPVFVLVRSRAGNFVYTAEEIAEMQSSILLCKELGYEGVVIGALTPENTIDLEAMKVLLEAAEGLKITFHRAFDELTDYNEGLTQLIDLGVDRILTSGLTSNAVAGAAMLAELVNLAGPKLVIMPGGGVRPENIESLFATGATEFHSSCIPPEMELTSVTMVKELLDKLSQTL